MPSLIEEEDMPSLVENDMPAANMPEATEVVEHHSVSHVVEHDEFAIEIIQPVKRHLALRRVKPSMWRHEATCYMNIRLFRAMDDGVKLAFTGVKWALEGKTGLYVVIIVACLGYKDPPKKNKKSAKMEDSRPTMVVLRHEKDEDQPLRFSQLFRVTAAKLFREGTPTKFVCRLYQQTMMDNVNNFIKREERKNGGEGWLHVPTLFQPAIPAIPAIPVQSPSQSSVRQQTVNKDQRTRYKKKQNVTKRLAQEKKREAQQVAKRKQEERHGG